MCMKDPADRRRKIDCEYCRCPQSKKKHNYKPHLDKARYPGVLICQGCGDMK